MPWFAMLAGAAIGGSVGAYGVSTGKNNNNYDPTMFNGDNPEDMHSLSAKDNPYNRSTSDLQNGIDTGNSDAWIYSMGHKASDAENRQGVSLNTQLGDQSRGQQEDALGLIQQRAMGKGPSVAQQQLANGMDQNIRQNAAMASGARGQAALAMAQQNAAAQNSLAAQNTNQQMAALRAQEMTDAQGMYLSGASGIRGMDEQRSATQAGLDMQQRQLNDQYSLGLYGTGAGLIQNQVNASTAARQQNIEIWRQQEALKQYYEQNAKDAREQNFKDIVGGAEGGMSMGLKGGK